MTQWARANPVASRIDGLDYEASVPLVSQKHDPPVLSAVAAAFCIDVTHTT